ncbi:hypothetical protein NIE88_08150 [Sporolactobacillus shoreicorticis]|uniref:Uncharacterized protein n=1 Tax=Sporolactobacillus shoreicorticis TaxID=1923877 RepID=A0ABW5S7V4_9BACL|nr:hypothetical protein [Sporolactobacillus shoreicorticis]MCO7125740.1 hypothetical protein [Sporolactobacillus shoreicorticis]
MVLAVTLCLIWIVVNLFIILPKRLSREENLFLFLTCSITIMISLLIPAKRMYFGDHGFNYSVEGTIAFLFNRNVIFPVLTLISINLVQDKGLWKKSLTFAASFLVFILFCKLEEKHTIVTSISTLILSVYFICYYILMLFLLKVFQLLGLKRQSGDE